MTSAIRMQEERVMSSLDLKGTTIVAVRKDGRIAIAGDGQVTGGQSYVVKGNATADAITLYELFEQKLNADNGDLTRAAVDLAKQWRMDKQLRNLEAVMLASDGRRMFYISGTGDVLEPEEDCMAIGSGGNYALAAAKAYLDSKVDLDAEEIARRCIRIASTICVYTNDNIICEVVG